jgi:hypothetical protein
MPYKDDSPAVNPAFDFDHLATALVDLLQRPRSSAFVLGLHGPWGSGKTTLLYAIRAQLPKNSIVVNFNAWKYQEREALWRALILRVLDALRKDGGADQKAIEELERSLYESFTARDRGPLRVNWTSAATEAALLAVSLGSLGIGGSVIGGVASAVKNFFTLGSEKEKGEDASKRTERIAGILHRESTERSIRQVVSIEQFQKLFSNVTTSLAKGRRIYVLIDDLDRCLPDSALEVFEAAKLFMDAPECAYVVAVDRAMIRRGLEWRYPKRTEQTVPPVVDPDEYIEKTITLSFDLPSLDESDAAKLIAEAQLPVALDEVSAGRLIEVLGTNPRRLKRFAATLATWLSIAQQLAAAGRTFGFSPLNEADRSLFLKLSCVGYINSAVIAEMHRDRGLAARLQRVWNEVRGNEPLQMQSMIAERTKNELPVIREAVLDSTLWRAMNLPPNLSDLPQLPLALGWFRSPGPASPVTTQDTDAAAASDASRR